MLQVLLSSLDYRHILISRCVILNRIRERKAVDGFRIFITTRSSDSVTLNRVRVVYKVLNCDAMDNFHLMHV